MNIPYVSVIIPVYKVEKYLERCVESVLQQTLENLEIILVDDGSPDRCPDICDQYVERDTRIKVIHKENGGLASARNAGMKIAAGKYIFFLDSDDWLELDGLHYLYELAQEYQVDFVRYRAIRTGWPGMEENVPCMVEEVREMSGGFYDRNRILSDIYPRLLATSQLTLGPVVGAWGSLYRLDFLKKNRLFFYEDIKFSEDVLFSANVIKHTEKFYYEDRAGIYHYYFNQNSISKSFRAGRWDSCKKIVEKAVYDFSEDKEYDFKKQLNWLTWFCILLALNERHNLLDKKQRKEYCRKILQDNIVKNCPLRISSLEVSNKQKLLLFMIKCNCWWIFTKV